MSSVIKNEEMPSSTIYTSASYTSTPQSKVKKGDQIASLTEVASKNFPRSSSYSPSLKPCKIDEGIEGSDELNLDKLRFNLSSPTVTVFSPSTSSCSPNSISSVSAVLSSSPTFASTDYDKSFPLSEQPPFSPHLKERNHSMPHHTRTLMRLSIDLGALVDENELPIEENFGRPMRRRNYSNIIIKSSASKSCLSSPKLDPFFELQIKERTEEFKMLESFRNHFMTVTQMASLHNDNQHSWVASVADLIALRVVYFTIENLSLSAKSAHLVSIASSSSSNTIYSPKKVVSTDSSFISTLKSTFIQKFNPSIEWITRMEGIWRFNTRTRSTSGSNGGAVILLNSQDNEISGIVKSSLRAAHETGKMGVFRSSTYFREKFARILSEKMIKAGLGVAGEIGVPPVVLAHVPTVFFETSESNSDLEPASDYLCTIHKGIEDVVSYKELVADKKSLDRQDHLTCKELVLIEHGIAIESMRMLGLLDTLAYQTDRGEHNLLIQRKKGSQQGKLVLIDNSLILPRGFRDPAFVCWLNWKGVDTPFSECEMNFIDSLSMNSLKGAIQEAKLPSMDLSTERTLYTSLTLLREGAKAGMNIQQIASQSLILPSDDVSIVIARIFYEMAEKIEMKKITTFEKSIDIVVTYYMKCFKKMDRIIRDAVDDNRLEGPYKTQINAHMSRFRLFCKLSLDECVSLLEGVVRTPNAESDSDREAESKNPVIALLKHAWMTEKKNLLAQFLIG